MLVELQLLGNLSLLGRGKGLVWVPGLVLDLSVS
jgi:hypothetical protein